MDPLPDPDDLDPDMLTLCEDCAKDEFLKRFVTRNAGTDGLCGICLSTHGISPVCALEHKADLTNLIKALVRFHFDEADYNPHVGGEDHPYSLLYRENPILEHETTLFCYRDQDRSYVFLEDLFDAEPYPEVDKGVSVYAGFDEDGGRHIQRAISRGENATFWHLRRRLFRENYFDVEPEVGKFLRKAGDHITRIIPAGASYARARIGAERFSKLGDGSLAYMPFEGTELGAPPAPKTSSGRLNRAGVAFLYIATDAETAAAEVRPHPSHILSIGAFIATRDLKVAAFDVGIDEFFRNEDDLDLFDFLFTADKAMSMPALPEDDMRYSITQVVADAVRNAGYDGITFRSSVADGQNLCVFNPDALAYVEGSAKTVHVSKLVYTMDPAPMVPPEDIQDYYNIDR